MQAAGPIVARHPSSTVSWRGSSPHTLTNTGRGGGIKVGLSLGRQLVQQFSASTRVGSALALLVQPAWKRRILTPSVVCLVTWRRSGDAVLSWRNEGGKGTRRRALVVPYVRRRQSMSIFAVGRHRQARAD